MTIEQLRSIGVDGALSRHGFPSIRELENLSPTPRNLGLVVLLTVTAVLWAPVATPGRAETSSPLPHDPKKPSHETDEVDPTFEERVIVTARADDMIGVADSATEGATGYQDLEKRPTVPI
jgi:hypothetical protein